MMGNKIVFLDIDGTLLDKSYKINSDRLKSTVKLLQKNGVVFALNSNRSLLDLLPVADKFNIHGPIIGENGVFIYFFDKKIKDYLLSQNQLNEARKQLVKIKNLIQKYLISKYKFVKWMDVDTVNFFKKKEKVEEGNGTVVVLNNKLREATISAHIKIIKKGELVSFKEEITNIVKYLRGEEIGDFQIDSSDIFANILVYSSLTSKRHAVEVLKKSYFHSYDFYAVGDELNDYNMIKGIGDFFTVKNASLKVKKNAKYISPFSYAKGVEDILKKI